MADLEVITKDFEESHIDFVRVESTTTSEKIEVLTLASLRKQLNALNSDISSLESQRSQLTGLMGAVTVEANKVQLKLPEEPKEPEE